MTRLIVDTDTAGDDVFSLLIALRDPRRGLEAITVCCGNVAFEQEVENALYTVEIAGRGGEIPVYAGCAEPLIAEWIGASTCTGRTAWATRSSRGQSSARSPSTPSTSSSAGSTRARVS
jgi:inosine-uridine nucleoside N-ribohydrolase